MARPEKKSESIEIRLPYSQKQAFMALCRERGVTASDVLRGMIANDIESSETGPEPQAWTMAIRNNPFKTAAGAAGAALAAAALGTGVSFAGDASFEGYDKNADGIITYGEFTGTDEGAGNLLRALGAETAKALNPGPMEGEGTFTRRTDQTVERGGKAIRILGLETFTYSIERGEETAVSALSGTKVIDPDATPDDVEAAYRALNEELKSRGA